MAPPYSPANPISQYGFTALSADASTLQPKTTTTAPPSTVPISELASPSTPLAARVEAYSRSKLSPETFAHSMRVYAYGLAIARQCFPDWHVQGGDDDNAEADHGQGSGSRLLDETWFCTALLHDIGTAEEFQDRTKLSFEFWGGIHALELLQHPAVTGGQDEGGLAAAAPREQAESVAEAIFRHQDVQKKGRVTLVTQLIQLATLLDNVGKNGELVAKGTIEQVVAKWPRKGWSGCFGATVEKEKKLKPWAMVSRIEGFEDMIMGNQLMTEYD